jgi:transcriptional regulator with XRE-family HTH domain
MAYVVFMTAWWEWVQEVSGQMMHKAIAERTGIDPSTISNWSNGNTKPKADNVVRFARTYGVSPVVGLIAAGILTENDVPNVVQIERPLLDHNIDELLDHIRSRVVNSKSLS